MTKLHNIAVLAFLSVCSLATAAERWESNPLVTNPAPFRALRDDVNEFGCEINLCFVLDGTKTITASEFKDQQNFADLIVAITTTDYAANYCAVHYNDFYTRISPRTSNQNRFLQKLHQSKQITAAQSSGGGVNVGRGFRYVVNQLLDRGKVANKVVLFSRGGRPFGKDPLNVSNYFRANNGGICGVVVGKDSTQFLEQVAPGTVVNFDGFFDLSEIVVALVADLCNMPCGRGARSC